MPSDFFEDRQNILTCPPPQILVIIIGNNSGGSKALRILIENSALADSRLSDLSLF